MADLLYWTGVATWIVLALVGAVEIGAWLIERFLCAANLHALFFRWYAQRLREGRHG